MQTAMNMAETSDCTQQHGAVVYKSGKVLATGKNVYKNEVGDHVDPLGISVHAEIAAIKQCSPENLKGATVYIARKGRCRAHLLSKPCPRCKEALLKAGVKKVIYTD